MRHYSCADEQDGCSDQGQEGGLSPTVVRDRRGQCPRALAPFCMRQYALIKGHRMQYDFSLKKPLSRRPQLDLTITSSAEQIVLAHWITLQFLRLLNGF